MQCAQRWYDGDDLHGQLSRTSSEVSLDVPNNSVDEEDHLQESAQEDDNMGDARAPVVTPAKLKGAFEENVEEYLPRFERAAKANGWDNAQKIRHLYLAGLSRLPTKKELMISNELLVARGGNTGVALQDIWWAVLNTNEFILIH